MTKMKLGETWGENVISPRAMRAPGPASDDWGEVLRLPVTKIVCPLRFMWALLSIERLPTT